MFPGHPWEGEDYGAAEYEWYLKRSYELGVVIEVHMRPFIDFCKERGLRSNQLIMKIAARLSAQYLPQYMLALNGRPYPARYPAGYVRPVRAGADMLEHVGIREKDGQFAERNIRENWKAGARWLAKHGPRLAVRLARWFPLEEIKDNYALMITRNPLRSLNTRVIVLGTHLRTMSLAIPFGERVLCTFVSPHAFGNINFFEPFLKDFKTWMEEPDKIPGDILEKPYKEAPFSG
jgi:hypothetical protein